MARFYLLEEALREEMRERELERRETREALWLHNLPDGEFTNTFRVTKEVFETICSEVIPLLPPKKNSRGIDPTVKILIALKFYGRGDYQGGVGRDNTAPMSQQAVSRCLSEVTKALNDPAIVRRNVRFPQNRHERAVIKTGFYNQFNVPGVCGAIDCTHVATFMICDDVNQILNVDASYGGATHDSFIWQNSNIRTHFEDLSATGETAVLLGDSGYPLREYIMMTPVDGAREDSPEGHYNAMQKRARSTIERTFGILKGRWRCLLAARQLHYSPETAGKIIIACSVLHNACVSARLVPLELSEEEAAREAERQRAAAPVYSATEALRRGRAARARLVRTLSLY